MNKLVFVLSILLSIILLSTGVQAAINPDFYYPAEEDKLHVVNVYMNVFVTDQGSNATLTVWMYPVPDDGLEKTYRMLPRYTKQVDFFFRNSELTYVWMKENLKEKRIQTCNELPDAITEIAEMDKIDIAFIITQSVRIRQSWGIWRKPFYRSSLTRIYHDVSCPLVQNSIEKAMLFINGKDTIDRSN